MDYHTLQHAVSESARIVPGSSFAMSLCGGRRARRSDALTPSCIEDVLSF